VGAAPHRGDARAARRIADASESGKTNRIADASDSGKNKSHRGCQRTAKQTTSVADKKIKTPARWPL
ncbi:hypothetical protein J8I87_36230, partial [Paraburkholderia sp. LEh10]|uniref:hypothetical protein n=1 Tax=Paraburkholderia sp. LEh10 TaxID=2821353 RepID=UPI001AE62777